MINGVYKALVYDNADPEERSRLRLLVPQIAGTEPSDWAWPIVPAATIDIAPPALSDPVWAIYEDGDVEHPAWLGTWRPSAGVSWTSVSFSNAWGDLDVLNPTHFIRLANKAIALEGGVAGGTVGAAAFTLPANAWPGRNLVIPGVTGVGTFTTIQINADGTVLSPSASSYRLDGINFVAGV